MYQVWTSDTSGVSFAMAAAKPEFRVIAGLCQ